MLVCTQSSQPLIVKRNVNRRSKIELMIPTRIFEWHSIPIFGSAHYTWTKNYFPVILMFFVYVWKQFEIYVHAWFTAPRKQESLLPFWDWIVLFFFFPPLISFLNCNTWINCWNIHDLEQSLHICENTKYLYFDPRWSKGPIIQPKCNCLNICISNITYFG